MRRKNLRLVIFTRYPQPGQAKTRLIPALGPEGAARLQRDMTEHLLATVDPRVAAGDLDLTVCYTGGDLDDLKTWIGPERDYRDQGPGDLGARMHRAFTTTLQAPTDAALIVGTDCPEITAEIIEQAFAALTSHDVVYGPAHDGGYYLVGLRRPDLSLFEPIDWGTDRVLASSLEQARAAGLSVALLPTLTDIDRPEDLPTWDHIRRVHGYSPSF